MDKVMWSKKNYSGPNFPDKTKLFCSMRLERALILLALQSIFFAMLQLFLRPNFAQNVHIYVHYDTTFSFHNSPCWLSDRLCKS